MIPAEEWWSIIEAYGARIWPAQTVFYIVAILLIGWLLLKPGRVQNWFTKLYLSIAFAWNGIVFFLKKGDVVEKYHLLSHGLGYRGDRGRP